jgi:glycosyltransferase involved in cell wall biosynthesis
MTTVRIIARDNGFGLTGEIATLRHALGALGCDVTVLSLDEPAEHERWRLGDNRLRSRWLARWHRRARRERTDINLMFEHIWPAHLGMARKNIVLPHPEWFDNKDVRHLPWVDQVWAKTHHAIDLFAPFGRPTPFIGFDSRDRFDPSVPRERAFFHLAGASPLKGTVRLMHEWAANPQWPTLTVVRNKPGAKDPQAPNIRVLAGYREEAELQRLQNAHLFHVCTSRTEGYGHYITEAMSVGAVVITVDAPPMNELVSAERGLLAAATAGDIHGLATLYDFDKPALAACVAQAMAMGNDDIARLGGAAREWFLQNKAGFSARLQAALAGVDV